MHPGAGSMLPKRRQETKEGGRAVIQQTRDAPPSSAHLYSPGDDPRVIAHSPEGAAQRHAAVFLGLEHHRASGEMTAGIQPAFLLSHFPIAYQPSGHVLVVHPCTVSQLREMTCPRSRLKPGWLGDPHRKFCSPLAPSLVRSSSNSHSYLPKGRQIC